MICFVFILFELYLTNCFRHAASRTQTDNTHTLYGARHVVIIVVHDEIQVLVRLQDISFWFTSLKTTSPTDDEMK